ncbi:MAG: SLBB domain-containing protein [Planctomycetes bacterium]|nr:SLBB domain-containing protein [Planctomycetota bacterium]
MRAASNAAVGLLLVLAGCRAAAPLPPAGVWAAEPAEPYWEQDDAFLQARAVAAGGAPSATPALDALAALAAATTPELTLRGLLEPLARPTPPARLRPGDLLALDVYGRPELGGERRVGADGRISMFAAGPLEVGGLTEAEAARAVEEVLRGVARMPQVQVRVLEPAPAAVRVVGRVAGGGGSAPLPPERALDVLDLIALSGGLLDDAAADRLTLLREDDGRSRGFHFTYDELLAARPAGFTAPLRPDDVLVVPRLPEVHVFGQVGRQGAFPLRPAATIGSLLVQAGGLTPGASARDVRVLRGEAADAPAALDQALAAGDVVFVPQRRRVFLVGRGLNTSGPLDLPGTGLTVVQALAAAGWVTKRADLDGVEVLRYLRGQATRFAVPLREILDGDRRDADYPLQPGDVLHVPEGAW